MSSQSAVPLACAYVTDRNYLPITCFSIASLFSTLSTPLPVYLLYFNLSAEDVETTRDYFARRRLPVELIDINYTLVDGLPQPVGLTKAIYGRLLLDRYLPASIGRVLYLDGDTLIDRDVATLAAYPMRGAPVGAVVDMGILSRGHRERTQARLGLADHDEYFNSGVLLIEWKEWPAISAASLDQLSTTPEKFLHPDQCALNMVCRGRWHALDGGWNLQPAAIQFAPRDSAIVHFVNSKKPWLPRHDLYPMKYVARYQRYFADSPWSAEFSAPGLHLAIRDGLRTMRRLVSRRAWREHRSYHRRVAPHDRPTALADDGR